MYQPWHRAAPMEAEVVAVTPPGRGHRISEPALLDFDSYVESLGTAITAVADRPFAFLGHSLGGLIAFEVARWLRAHSSCGPTHLIVLASAAPRCQTAMVWKRRALLSDDDLEASMSKRYGSLPPVLLANAELRTLLLSAFRDDLRLAGSYEYRTDLPLRCPISVLVGRDDSTVSAPEVAPWAEETSGKFTVISLPGAHMFIDSLISEVIRIVWSTVIPRQDLLVAAEAKR